MAGGGARGARPRREAREGRRGARGARREARGARRGAREGRRKARGARRGARGARREAARLKLPTYAGDRCRGGLCIHAMLTNPLLRCATRYGGFHRRKRRSAAIGGVPMPAQRRSTGCRCPLSGDRRRADARSAAIGGVPMPAQRRSTACRCPLSGDRRRADAPAGAIAAVGYATCMIEGSPDRRRLTSAGSVSSSGGVLKPASRRSRTGRFPGPDGGCARSRGHGRPR